MFFFAHLGGGSQMVLPLRPRLPLRWLLLGCVLPDLIDKPLYYGLSWIYGPDSGVLQYLGCTRNFGHTLWFLLFWWILARCGFAPAAALGWGIASHDLLDWVEDLLCFPGEASSEVSAFFYPWTGHFASYPPSHLGAHLMTVFTPFRLTTEAVGLILLIWLLRRRHADHEHLALEVQGEGGEALQHALPDEH